VWPMHDRNLNQLLPEVVDAVLETMFFTATLGPAEPETGAEVLEARVAFRGPHSGTLHLCLTEPGAQMLAAGFLGEEEEMLTGSQTGQVVCELANMLCGSLVSKLESGASFNLSSPELVPVVSRTGAGSQAPAASRQSFELESGILTVILYLEEAA
jgi:CheY-specific phosphatase CheX